MEVLYLNRESTDVRTFDEIVCLRNLLIGTEKVQCTGIVDFLAGILYHISTIRDSVIFQLHKTFLSDTPEAEQIHAQFDPILKAMKIIKARKHKSKHDLELMHSYQYFASQIRGSLADYIKNNLWVLRANELLVEDYPEMIKHVEFSLFEGDGQIKDLFPGYIYDALQTGKVIPVLPGSILGFAGITEAEKIVNEVTPFSFPEEMERFRFFNTLLWSFPPLETLEMKKFIAVRSSLQPLFQKFSIAFSEASSKIKAIPWPKDNPLIGECIEESVGKILAEIKEAISQNVFLSYAASQFPPSLSSNLYLGISSIENILDLYEITRLLHPRDVSDLKEKLGKVTDLASSHPFLFVYANYPFDVWVNDMSEWNEEVETEEENSGENK